MTDDRSRGDHVQRLTPVMLGRHDTEDDSILCTASWDPTDGQPLLRNVTAPTLTPYLPDPERRTGTGVVVVPGGGLHFLAVENEGARVAERLAERGIAAFVLHYRVTPTPVDDTLFAAVAHRIATEPEYIADISRVRRAVSLADGAAALRSVRRNRDTWGVDPGRIGMLGFSAGGFVSLVTTLDGTPAERPSFVAPIYPAWWGEIPVPQPAPPMFIAWATDDSFGDTVVGACLRLDDAWARADAPVEAHAYAAGGHGFGMRPQGTPSDGWFDAFLSWLTASGF
jgi:acetyl esterase/lipase